MADKAPKRGGGRPPVVIPAKGHGRPGDPPVADLDAYRAAIDAVDDAKISAASKAQYRNQLKRLTETVGRPVEWMLEHCEAAMRLLLKAKRTDGRAMIEAPMTVKAMIDPLIALLRHVPGLKERFPDARTRWDELYREVGARSNDRYENNLATEKSAANFVPWARIVEARDAMLLAERGAPGMDSVVVALHTFVPPARADYNRVRVYVLSAGQKGKGGDDPWTPSEAERGADPNFLVWTRKRATDSGGTMRLTLDEFKTRKKKEGAHEVDLPPPLVAVLARSLEARPRRYLVVGPEARSDDEPMTASAYAQYVTRVFSALLGKHTTVNSLRHAFSSQLDLNTLTPKQRQEIADALMHSPEMTHRYRYANVGEEGSTASASASATASAAASSLVGAQCELVCRKPRKNNASVAKAKLEAATKALKALGVRR